VFNGKSLLALIPARGGSKGLPGKNIINLAGKPMIAWTIEAAAKNRHIDKLVVSTDDEEIMRVAQTHGAELPFKRPKKYSTDIARGIDVVLHAMQWLKKKTVVRYFDPPAADFSAPL